MDRYIKLCGNEYVLNNTSTHIIILLNAIRSQKYRKYIRTMETSKISSIILLLRETRLLL